MLHPDRRWGLTVVAGAEELARQLTGTTRTLCSGFAVAGHEGYLFLNDSTHEDGAAEYAVLRREGGRFVQVESITFGWCDPDAARQFIREAVAGAYDSCGPALALRVDEPGRHERCHLCA
jgi:hypothetical protein